MSGKKLWHWHVYRATDGVQHGGEEWSFDRAKDYAEYAHSDLGPRGVTVKITSPRGTTYFLVPKSRTSGMKWERRP